MNSRLRIASAFLLLAMMLSIIPSAVTAASAASTCDWAQFVADVTVPDGTNYAANTAFKKTWRLKNIGTCTWSTSYALVFDSGEKFGAPASVNFPISVAPGQTVDLSLDMTSPGSAGHFFSYWKLKNASGVIFGIGSTANKSFWAEINVATTSGAGYDFTANAASAAWTSGAGALTFPGTDGDAKGFGLKKDKPKFESGVESAQAGMLFAPQNVTSGFIQASYPAFKVQSGDRFQSTIGCEYNATTCYVAYRLDYQIGSGAVKTFWTFREKYEGWTYNANLDLSSLAGQDVKFILVINAYGSPTGDRALWGSPVIARAGGVIVTPPTVTGTPPSPTPTSSAITPTITPMSTTCDRAQFISDVTVPDGTTFAPATVFKKTWSLKNVGTCTWTTGYSLIFDTGEKMGGPNSAPMPLNVAPGQTVNISIDLTSPNAGGTYRGYWKFKNSLGAVFGIGSAGTKSFWVEIKVSGSTATPGTPTTGPSLTPVPPVAGVSYDFAANACQGTWFSGAGQLPCPGTEGDAKGFVLKVTPSKLENGTSDPRMGLITFPQNVDNGYIQGFFPSYKVKAGDRFRSIVSCEYNATSCRVVFRLDYQTGTDPIQTFYAFLENYEGQYYQEDLDLSSLVGKDVKFILTVLATGSPTGDRALWVAPMIFNPASVATPTNTPMPPTITVTPSPTFTLTPSPTGYKYDFGTALSPLAAGYARVIETTAYSAGGFGWTDTSGLESRDRSAVADDLNRDFVSQSSAARTFKLDLTNGNYSVSVTMGDNDYAHDNMVVKANGTTMLADVDNAVGAFTANTFAVTVNSGSLALEFSDAGGTDPTWVVNSVSITKTP